MHRHFTTTADSTQSQLTVIRRSIFEMLTLPKWSVWTYRDLETNGRRDSTIAQDLPLGPRLFGRLEKT